MPKKPQAMPPPTNDALLTHESHHPDAPTTILLLHGAFSSPDEYKHMIPLLPSYHLLIPCLPSHGPASSVSLSLSPFTLSTASEHLDKLVASVAKNGRAHIVGVSLGAHVAINFAGAHPERCLSIFASGYNRFAPSFWTPILPPVIWAVQSLTHLLPKPVIRRLVGDDTDNDTEELGGVDMALLRQVVSVIVSNDEIRPIGDGGRRLLMVAATNRGLVPSNDRPDHAIMVRDVMRRAGADKKSVQAVQMKEMRHPWQVQAPNLFAKSVTAWIEKGELTEGMEEL